ncbi:MAG: DUF2075 domain-containing protein [Paludibacteraceae bacterium]|nr:DUF2075 domain-containing protein [Paludibacteraceae bacterium]
MSNRCLYHAIFHDFISAEPMKVLGLLHSAFHGEALTTTDEAWEGEIQILQRVLFSWKNEDAHIIFEYDIPRLGKRIDVVLLLRGLIFCLEFKVGKAEDLQADIEQVLDYALDLKNFHLYSENKRIVPVLIPTKYPKYTKSILFSVYNEEIYNPFITGEEHLQNVIRSVLDYDSKHYPTIPINSDEWGANWIISPYSPTPTIVEAARTLYQNHSVEDITRHEADDVATDTTTQYVLDVIEHSKRNREKSICFVTGVPGAGKTLVGLQVAVKQTYKNVELNNSDGAVYLSGNGPLVAVLTEALAKDDQKRMPERI